MNGGPTAGEIAFAEVMRLQDRERERAKERRSLKKRVKALEQRVAALENERRGDGTGAVEPGSDPQG